MISYGILLFSNHTQLLFQITFNITGCVYQDWDCSLTVPCGMLDLNSPTRDQTYTASSVSSKSPNHWTAKAESCRLFQIISYTSLSLMFNLAYAVLQVSVQKQDTPFYCIHFVHSIACILLHIAYIACILLHAFYCILHSPSLSMKIVLNSPYTMFFSCMYIPIVKFFVLGGFSGHAWRS